MKFALQLKRLKWSLRHAYDNVAMYRERFDAANVHPDDVNDLSDLAKFPFHKNDLRDHYPFGDVKPTRRTDYPRAPHPARQVNQQWSGIQNTILMFGRI